MLTEPIYFTGCDLSPGGHVRLAAFLRQMQSVACKDLDLCGLSQENLQEIGLAFILSKSSLRIEDPRLQGADIRLSTAAKETRGASFLRDFLFYRGDRVVARASTRWALLRLDTRTLARPKELPLAVETTPAHTADLECPRLPACLPDDCTDLGTQEIPLCMTDANAHLNNAAYLDLALNRLPDAPYHSLDIEYRRELGVGERVRLLCAAQEDCILLSGIRQSDGAQSFMARLCLSCPAE